MIILCENKTDPEYKEILENALKTEKSEKLASYLRNQLPSVKRFVFWLIPAGFKRE